MKSIEQKRKEAIQRAARRATLTHNQQLLLITNNRPGDSKREKNRLAGLIVLEREKATQAELEKLNKRKKAGKVIIPSSMCEAKKR